MRSSSSPAGRTPRRTTPLKDIDPYTAAAVHSAGRVTDRPGHGTRRPITFNSAT
ncbi:hypothetical protein [Streptomyces hokutonensis]|uniref:hypothetical protein n=1 Tax=Streptomyces hokutonensis TaxID=1306990 RepID=UPI0036CF82A9